MSSLFPVHRIEAGLKAEDLDISESPKPAWRNRRFSLPLASYLVELCALAESGTEPFLIKQQNEDVFVAFRSGGDPASIFNVLGLTQVTAPQFCRGIVYGPLLESYRASVQARLGDLPKSEYFWLTGHGAGAAYALLAAAELPCVSAVYTFGAPRIGSRSFVRSFAHPVFRVVNNLDVMATLPVAWKWRHAGRHKLINADGSLNHNPGVLNRVPSLLRQTLWLGKMLCQGLSSGFPRPLFTLMQQVLGDHALDSYRLRLRALLRSPS